MLYEHARMDYIQFEYRQPTPLEGRGVTWLQEAAASMERLGHGTYWECAANIMGTGKFWPSDADSQYGVREYHGTEGVYLTEQFEAYGEHYAWPCNVFGNNCLYGICFNVLANRRFMKKVWVQLCSGV